MNNFEYKNNDIQLGFTNNMLKNLLSVKGVKDVDKFLNLDDSVIEDFNKFDNMQEVTTKILIAVNDNKQIQILWD